MVQDYTKYRLIRITNIIKEFVTEFENTSDWQQQGFWLVQLQLKFGALHFW